MRSEARTTVLCLLDSESVDDTLKKWGDAMVKMAAEYEVQQKAKEAEIILELKLCETNLLTMKSSTPGRGLSRRSSRRPLSLLESGNSCLPDDGNVGSIPKQWGEAITKITTESEAQERQREVKVILEMRFCEINSLILNSRVDRA